MKNHNARCRMNELSQDKEDLVTPRDKKINDLSLVLERQKKTIQKLLSEQRDKSSEKSERKAADNEIYLNVKLASKETKGAREPTVPSKYQQICNQVVDIGNRVLASHRKNQQPEAIKESPQKLIEKSTQKLNVTDKQLQYLQSEQYRVYLQNITQQAQSAEEIIKKMRQARNNNIYSQNKTNGKDQINQKFERNPPPPQRRKYDEILVHQTRKRSQNLNNYAENRITYRREFTPRAIDRNVFNAIEELSVIQNEVKIKQMVHSPTMTEIQKTFQPLNDAKTKKHQLCKSKSCNKLQSKTIQYTIENQPQQTQNKNLKTVRQQSINDSRNSFEYATPIKQQKKRYIKQWNADVLKIQYPLYSHSQISKKDHQPFQKAYFPKSSSKQEKRNVNYEEILYYQKGRQKQQKSNKMTKKYQKKVTNPSYKRQQQQNQNQSKQYFNPYKNSSKQIVNYPIEFKLKNPGEKHSHTKTASFQNQSNWNTIYLKQHNYYQPSKKQIKINPHFANIHQIKKQKIKEHNKQNFKHSIDIFKQLDQSSVTSAVTRALQNQPRSHARSQSKLSIVTPSKRQKK